MSVEEVLNIKCNKYKMNYYAHKPNISSIILETMDSSK